MWKLVIADDERLIVKGLKKLIDWKALNVQIVGEAYNGENLQKLIEEKDPDIVVTDIMMPYITGLELIRQYNGKNSRAKFIFVSGYQEFSYVQEALKNGAVDYLLKPVSQKALENAVKKAIQMLEAQHTVHIFREEKDEFQKLFENINNGRNYENEDLYEVFRRENINFQDCFFVGLCAGICPDQAIKLSAENFGRFNLLRFGVYNRFEEYFGRRKRGFVVRKDEDALHIIGVFPNRDKKYFVEKYVEPIRRQVERDSGIGVCVGIGTPTAEPSEILYSYKSAKLAFGLYNFEEKKVINVVDAHREYKVSFEDYKDSVERAFRAIISKDSEVMDRIDNVMDNIEAIHYGNWSAVKMRTMHFAGDLGSKLNQYHLLDVDFYVMQDDLQVSVEACATMHELKRCIHAFFEDLIHRIYEKGKFQEKVLIEDVKAYIREHYQEDLSIRELADLACVSQNYFSAMFKKETGQNYKAFLTDIRMEKALQLLQETDYKTYEISELVGYNNVRRFVDAFKKRFNVSPMEYKKAMKKES